jgi:hypothetical protein
MTMDPAQAPSGSAGGGAARLLPVMLILGPPVAISGWMWPTIRANLPVSVLVLLTYWVLLGLVRFVLRVGRAVSDLWIPRLAKAIDRKVSAILGSYRERYLRQLLGSVRDIELLGVATQGEFSLQLKNVYVDVSLARRPLQETAHEPFVGAEAQPGERRTLESFLDAGGPQVFAVLGGPGTGKTTLLRRTAMALGEGPRQKRSLPLLLYLRDHVHEIVTNPAVTVAELLAGVAWLRGMVAADWFERNLTHGRCAVLLDGLDEVAVEDNRQCISMWVRDQVARYPDNNFVITSRPYGYRSNPLSKAEVLQVRRFTSDQIYRFVRGWYYAIECRSTGETGERTRAIADEHADDLLRRMRLQPALYDLAANPLLLTMIANVHKYRGALPGSRAALYGEMCDLLLQRRQEAKNLPVGSGLKAEQRAKVVRKLALAMMSQEVRDVTLATAQEIIGPTLARIPQTTTADAFLDEVTKSGLLVEREVGKFAFAHLTLQEYLAAVEIREYPEANVLPKMVDKPWWRETSLLWAANADASPVVEACLESGSIKALALAFDCADEAREVDANLQRRLDALLYSEAAIGSPNGYRDSHRLLISAVRASRCLRQTITLANGTVTCARPLPRSLYRLYSEWSERSTVDGANREPLHLEDDVIEAVGVSRSEVGRLITWVNGLFDDGTVYRLPTHLELTDPLIGMVVDVTRRTVWYRDVKSSGRPAKQGDSSPQLFLPPNVSHPYVGSADHLHQAIRRDLLSLAGVLPFVLSYCLERDPEHARIRDFTTASKRLDELSRSMTPGLVRNPIHVDRALARSLDGNLSQGRDLARLTERVRDLAAELTKIVSFANSEEYVRDFNASLRRNPAVVESLDEVLDIVLTRSLQNEDISMLVEDLQSPERTPMYARSPLASGDELEFAVLALTVLLSIWAPQRTKHRPGQGWAQFEEFLVNLFPVSAEIRPTLPEEVEIALQDVANLLVTTRWAKEPEYRWEGRRPDYAAVDTTRSRQSWRILARRLTSMSEASAGTIARSPDRWHSLGPAIRIGLLAVVAVADQLADEDISAILRGVHSSLTCIDARRNDPGLASEVVLLVRT